MTPWLYGAAVLLGAVVVVLTYGLYQIATPSHGKPIDRGQATRRALLVVDVQQVFTDSLRQVTSEGAVEAALARINVLATQAKSTGDLVIYTRNVFSRPATQLVSRLLFRGAGCPGTGGLELDARLTVVGKVVVKSVGDAFSEGELEDCLQRHQVGEVVLAGLDGIACVQRTARGALQRGYHVQVARSAVLTGFPEKWQACLTKLQDSGATVVD